MSRCACRITVAPFAVLVFLAGCLGGSGSLEDHLPAAGIAARGAEDIAVSEGVDPLVLEGRCEDACSVELAVDQEGLLRLFVTVAWDGTQVAGLDVDSWQADEVRHGHDGVRLTFEPPMPSRLQIDITGTGDHRLTARMVRDGPGPWLPDLVTTLPGGLRIPSGVEEHDDEVVAFEAGCRAEEQEAGAVRCLRFGNAPGNVGAGVLELRLDEATGEYWQRILEGGTVRERLAGGGEYHPHHDHFHYAAFAQTRLYRFDIDTGLRGAEVVAGTKTGFCPLDSGAMEDAEPEPDPRRFREADCEPPSSGAWITGVSVGRYDLYPSHFVDQYLEVDGLRDGVYQLVSTVDPSGTLLEEDTLNNAASVVLRLAGGEVEVLEARAFYGMVPRMY